MNTEQIASKISQLPESLQSEVLDFIGFLEVKYQVAPRKADDQSVLDLKGGLESSKTFKGNNMKIQERLRDEWS
ncbi:DUF2281 domain-containing protein [Modicisalibacter muralis]|nr:DUF2281 domain-containing protein [Halomonas muralis]